MWLAIAIAIAGPCGVAILAQVSRVQPTGTTVPPTVGLATATRLVSTRRIGHSTEATSFGKISKIAADPNGGVLAFDLDAETHPLLRFGVNGGLIARLGAFGEGPGQFARATSIAVTVRGEVVAYDIGRARLTVWGPDGKLLRTLTTRGLGGFLNLANVRAGPEGKVFISQEERPSDLRPGTAAWTHLGSRSFLVDLTSGAVVALPWQDPIPPAILARPFGPRTFRQPLVTGQIAEAVSDRLGFRALSPRGSTQSEPVRFTRPQVSREERIEQERYRDFLQERLDPFVRPERWGIPVDKQAVTDLRSDHQGRVWIRVATDGFPGKERILVRAPDGSVVTARFRDHQLWAAFLPTGKYLGAVLFPDSIEDVVFSGGYAWGIERDDDDLQYLVQFKLPW